MRKFLRIALMAIVFGVVLSLSLAIVCAFCFNNDKAEKIQRRHTIEYWRWVESRGFGVWKVRVDPLAERIYRVPGKWVDNVVSEMPTRGGLSNLPAKDLPAWCRPTEVLDHKPTIAGVHDPIYWRSEGFGWPFPCLSCTWVLRERKAQFEVINGIVRGEEAVVGDAKGFEKAIPTRLLYGGLITNSAFFAIIFLACHFVPREFISYCRFRLRRCVKCGYDVRTVTDGICPECGTRR